jgi:hypothetical protein
LFGREDQVPVTLLLRGKRGENTAAYTEIRRSHVRTLLRAFQAQSESSKIRSRHETSLLLIFEERDYSSKRVPRAAGPHL